jgi:PhnB protein
MKLLLKGARQPTSWSPNLLPTDDTRVHLDIYVNYPGHCEEAFRFYEQHLGGYITGVSRHAEAQNPALPADWTSKILHARIEIGTTILMGADIPGAEPMRSAYLTLRLDSPAEAERVYALLSEGGQVFMKMEETFFASRFAMLRDRFGTSWMLLHERSTDPGASGAPAA